MLSLSTNGGDNLSVSSSSQSHSQLQVNNNDATAIFCLFVCNRGDTVSRRSPIKGVRPSPYTNPRQALSSCLHQQMVWLYWLQNGDTMPNWYTINHPTTLHAHNETVTHCCSPMALCAAGCILQAKLPSLALQCT